MSPRATLTSRRSSTKAAVAKYLRVRGVRSETNHSRDLGQHREVPRPAKAPETAAEPSPLTLREPCPCCGAPMRIIEILRAGGRRDQEHACGSRKPGSRRAPRTPVAVCRPGRPHPRCSFSLGGAAPLAASSFRGFVNVDRHHPAATAALRSTSKNFQESGHSLLALLNAWSRWLGEPVMVGRVRGKIEAPNKQNAVRQSRGGGARHRGSSARRPGVPDSLTFLSRTGSLRPCMVPSQIRWQGTGQPSRLRLAGGQGPNPTAPATVSGEPTRRSTVARTDAGHGKGGKAATRKSGDRPCSLAQPSGVTDRRSYGVWLVIGGPQPGF